MSQVSPSALRQRRRGMAAVEFALVLPFLCFLFIVAVDFGRVYYYSLTVSNCARNGALYGSADKNHALDGAGIGSAAKADAGNLDLELINVISSPDCVSNPTCVDVTVTYPFRMITQFPGIPGQTNLSRTVRMSVLPPTPKFN